MKSQSDELELAIRTNSRTREVLAMPPILRIPPKEPFGKQGGWNRS